MLDLSRVVRLANRNGRRATERAPRSPFPPSPRPCNPARTLTHQKNTRSELCTTESQRLAAARSVIIPVVASAAPSFILLSFVRHFSTVSSLPFLSSERDRSRSAESVRSFGLSSILPRFAPSLRLIHRSFLSLSLSLFSSSWRTTDPLDHGDYIGSRRWNDGSDARYGRSVDAR